MNHSLALSLFAFSLFAVPAIAQDQTGTPPSAAAPVQQTAPAPVAAAPAQAPTASVGNLIADAPMQDTEVTVMKDNFADSAYVTPSLENLSRLYWRLGVFNLNDKTAIDNYLLINECDIYQSFFHDDFEWANVRKSTSDMLKEKAPGFSDKFKILVPIDLGRYDTQQGGFSLVTNTAFINSRRIQVTGDMSASNICGKKDELQGYPTDVVMILNKPFTFDHVKVNEHVAQAFLLRKKYNTTPLPRELRSRGFQRPAFARMRVTFVRYQGTTSTGRGNRSQAILYGRLDGIDVFEDMNEEMLLTSINYQ